MGPLLFAVAFRGPLAALRERLLECLETEHGLTREDAERDLVLGAYLDDVLVALLLGALAEEAVLDNCGHLVKLGGRGGQHRIPRLDPG